MPDRDGSGFATRELYSDADEAIFSVQLPIVLNGIAEVVIAGDLQDRSVVLTLPRIDGYTSEDDSGTSSITAAAHPGRAARRRRRRAAGRADGQDRQVAANGGLRPLDPAAAPALGWDPTSCSPPMR